MSYTNHKMSKKIKNFKNFKISKFQIRKCQCQNVIILICQNVKYKNFQNVKNVTNFPKCLLCPKKQKQSQKYQMSSDKFHISNLR